MNLTRTMNDVGSLYEEKVFIPKDTFAVQTEKKPKEAKADAKAFISKNSGPAAAEGVNKDIIDPKTAKDDNFYEPKKFSQNCEKTETKNINNFMNKSIFDKLYEDVMSDRMDDMESTDLDALGLPGEEPGAEGEGEGDQVTITLDKELAQKLHDVLMSVLGEAEGEGEMEGEAEGEAEDEMDASSEDAEEDEEDGDDASEDNETLGEATDLQELPKSKGESLQSKNNKVGDVTSSLKSSGEGDGKVKSEVDGKGKDLPTSKGASLQNKSNKVASKTSKVGAYLAGLK